mgnify:CR=1 FL=1
MRLKVNAVPFPIARVALSSFSLDLLAIMMSYPNWLMRVAVASPMPELPPMMTTVCAFIDQSLGSSRKNSVISVIEGYLVGMPAISSAEAKRA